MYLPAPSRVRFWVRSRSRSRSSSNNNIFILVSVRSFPRASEMRPNGIFTGQLENSLAILIHSGNRLQIIRFVVDRCPDWSPPLAMLSKTLIMQGATRNPRVWEDRSKGIVDWLWWCENAKRSRSGELELLISADWLRWAGWNDSRLQKTCGLGYRERCSIENVLAFYLNRNLNVFFYFFSIRSHGSSPKCKEMSKFEEIVKFSKF